MYYETSNWPKLLVPDSEEDVVLIYEALDKMRALETLNYRALEVGEPLPNRQSSSLAEHGIWELGRPMAHEACGALPILDLQTRQEDLDVAVRYARQAVARALQDPA